MLERELIMNDYGELFDRAMEILYKAGISYMDLLFLKNNKAEYLSDKSDANRLVFGIIDVDDYNNITRILFFSRSDSYFWNIRALWVDPKLRRQGGATSLLDAFKKLLKSYKNAGVSVFVPFNEIRFELSRFLLRNGFTRLRFISSITSTEYVYEK